MRFTHITLAIITEVTTPLPTPSLIFSPVPLGMNSPSLFVYPAQPGSTLCQIPPARINLPDAQMREAHHLRRMSDELMTQLEGTGPVVRKNPTIYCTMHGIHAGQEHGLPGVSN